MSDDSFDGFMDEQIACVVNWCQFLDAVDREMAGRQEPKACRAFVAERLGAALEQQPGPAFATVKTVDGTLHSLLQLEARVRANNTAWAMLLVNTLRELWRAQNPDDGDGD